MKEVTQILVREDDPIAAVVGVIDRGRLGLALVVDEHGLLKGTITDGDVRRLLLRGGRLDETAAAVMNRTFRSVQEGTPAEEISGLLQVHMIRHMPVLDAQGRAVGLVTLGDLVPAHPEERVAVIMAGGEGRRLRPITESIPKPMVELGGKPILARQIESLALAGFREVFLAVNYKADVIEGFFGDGSGFGVRVHYLRERGKLGTIGALSLLPESPAGPLLVMNGDVVTDVNLESLFDYHRRSRCVATVGATRYEIRVPLGVLRLAGPFLAGIDEKPQLGYLCNAGIFVLEPEVVRLVPRGEKYDMTELLDKLVARGQPVAVFPVREHWIDVGRPEDLDKAREAARASHPQGADA
ncbi:MAG: nucleotidyltransferase family protein [Deltaproteobacteria bacterium]|nr:nucleotidyltransferase family protein [Deltaproteobacteria bacterium]